MKERYTFDKTRMEFRKATRSVRTVLGKALKYFLVTASLAVLYYTVFSLVVSTDSERELRERNKMYRQLYAGMEERERLLGDVLVSLAGKDDEIYRRLFDSEAPDLGAALRDDFISGVDSVPDREIVAYAADKLRGVAATAARVEENFLAIAARCQAEEPLPPLSSPVGTFSYARTGASVGEKINPFYKVGMKHSGLDLIAQRGDPVYAAADGVVSEVVHATKGLGNVVEIRHAGGYLTRYAHLENTRVYRGQRVRSGAQVGQVGMSGKSFAPHLHYEVLRDSVLLDPVHFFFGSVKPEEYMGMIFMSANAGQSMD